MSNYQPYSPYDDDFQTERRYPKSRKVAIAVALICAVLSIAMFSYIFLYSGTDPSTGSSDFIDSSNHSTTNRFAQGELATIGGLEIMLIEIKENNGGDSYYQPSEGNIYILVYFEISNVSNEDKDISTMLQFTAYVDNYKIAQNIWAKAHEMVDSGNFADTLDTTLSAGRKVIGSIGYEVPADWKTIEVEFASDPFKLDQKVILCAENPNR